eukprot:SAG25_NODE_3347_length_1117_cov_0.851670_1_plen_99_part_10
MVTDTLVAAEGVAVAEALGAPAQRALQVQGGGRCWASELRKKRDKMQSKVTVTEVQPAEEAGGGAPGGERQGDPRAADGPTVTRQPAAAAAASFLGECA